MVGTAQPKPVKACLRCGASIGGRPSHADRRKFCSKNCEMRHKFETNPNRLRPCPVCGGNRLQKRQTGLGSKTCSAKCGYLLRKSRTRKPRLCSVCGVSYFPGGRHGTKFCSRKCFGVKASERPMLLSASCEVCGASFKRTAAALKRVSHSFCGQACRARFMSGENHPMFRGDKDPNRGAAWNTRAEGIRVRDGHKCKRCGLTQEANGQKLSVDHIRPWRSFADKAVANEPENLASLCRKCHSFKTSTVEKAWLRGDVIAWKQWVASLSLPSAARFGMMA